MWVTDFRGSRLDRVRVAGKRILAGITDTPIRTARLRASILLPRVRSVLGLGPMKIRSPA